MAVFQVMLDNDHIIQQDGLQKLCELLDELAPGQTVKMTYYYGTQEEDWDSGSYDDDFWMVEVEDGGKNYSGCGNWAGAAFEACLLKAREGS